MIPAGLDIPESGGYMRRRRWFFRRCGCVAQLVEQLTLNQRVHSSILCTPTKSSHQNNEVDRKSGAYGAVLPRLALNLTFIVI